ncbi:MAG: hypothetical protein EOO73_34610 [Myxococcales bacterium]|nr:MAG: hypothetical protein EOO73_34610 [Myxococcales bacterium]
MSVPNPYFIHIELFWPDLTRPTQNQIARVKAVDVNGATVTDEGQSGYDPASGGWQPVFMQNIAAFYPPREKPNLRFQVLNTSEQVVHTTQVFGTISSGSTVRIVIGQSDQLIGAGTPFVVSGTVRRESGSLVTSGTVQAFDVTTGSEALLGTVSLSATGAYSIAYTSISFSSNGVPHTQPNLRVRAFDTGGQVLALSALRVAASANEIIDLTAADLPAGQFRVFGSVRNEVKLPVAGVLVQAYQVVWTAAGLQEILLGAVLSDGKGDYEIRYTPQVPEQPLLDCGPDADEVNLIVYAKEGTAAAPGALLGKAPPVSPAATDQRVDLVVDKVSSVTVSEYTDTHAKLSGCLGATDEARWATINQLGEREDLLSIVARTSGVGFDLLKAYVAAWRITGQINEDITWSALGLSALQVQAVYGLVRLGHGSTLNELLELEPTAFLTAVVDAIERNVVDRALEANLDPDVTDSLQNKWREVLVHYLGLSTESWQAKLLELVFPGPADKFYAKTAAPRASVFAVGTAHAVAMPTVVNPGDLLIALVSNRGASATSTVTTPPGWTQLFSTLNGTGASAVRFGGYVKAGAGTEDVSPATVNFQTAADQHLAAQVYRVEAGSWTGSLSDVVAGAAASGNSTTINPPPLSPPWGSDLTLWLTAAAHGREFALSSSPPSYAGPERTNSSTASGNCTTLSARRELTAASEDPGNFVIATAIQWVAQTIAIRPAPNTGAKRKVVTAAHFQLGLPFAEMLKALAASGAITTPEAQNLRFAFELYEALDQYFPLVKAIYLDKASRGYQTIADLSKVALEPSGAAASWYAYALNQQSYTTGPNTFPGDVPGATPEEKARVFAQRLYDKFGGRSPETRFVNDALKAAQSTNDVALAGAAQFVADHADFNLQTTPIDKYLTDENIDLDPSVLSKLKQLQRVARLTPKLAAALYLVTAGLDSAVAIARVEEGQFIADHEEALGLTEAQSIHRKAKHYSAEVFSTIVRFNQSLAGSGGSQVLPAALSLQSALAETVQASSKFPNWVTLFGSLYSAASKHCQTVLSPGAYLVDLLDNFLKPSVKSQLLARRADLADIELTCANTDRAVPYIDLVNEILAAVIAPHQVAMRAGAPAANIAATVLTLAAGGDGPSTALVLGVLRGAGYLLTERALVKASPLDKPAKREWLVEDDAWRFTIRAATPPHSTGAFVAFGAPQTSARADDLEVFPEHANPGAETALRNAVFPLNLPLALSREEIELILAQRGSSRSEVLETFRADPSTSSILTDPGLALAYLGLTAAEAAAVLTPLADVNAYWGFPNVSGNVSVPRPESPHILVSGPWLDVLAEVSVFLHRAGLTYAELNELLDTQFIHDTGAPIALDASDESLLEANYNRFFLVGLSAERLRRISFFLRAMRKLGWSMRELDRYLMLLGERAGSSVLLPTSFVRLAQLVRLSRWLARPVSALLGYFADLDLRRSERHPKSLFDDVYLRGAPVSDEYQGMNGLAQGQPLTLTHQNVAGYKNYVRGALRVGAQDFEALWAAVGPAALDDALPNASVPLTVAQLSALYRMSDFCRAVGLSVKDFLAAKLLLGIDPFPSGGANLLSTFQAIEQIRRLQTSGISARFWQYLLRHEVPAGESAGPSAEDLQVAHRRMASVGGELASRYPALAAPSLEIVGAALGEALSADRVARTVDVLRREAADISAEDEAFVATAFTFFLADGTAPFTANLLRSTPDPAQRLGLVWSRLRPFLLERARREAALTLASELLVARRETVDALLRRALSSVTSSSGTAWDDLVAGLGAWRKGDGTSDETLESEPAGTWASHWVVPADGRYAFVVAVNAANASASDLVLRANGQALTPAAPIAVDGQSRFVFAPAEYKSSALVALSFQYTGASQVTLLVRRDDGDPGVLPASALSPFDERAYLKLWKALTVVRGLRLSTNELEYLIEEGLLLDDLPLAEPDPARPDVPWAAVAPFLDELALNRSVSLDQTTLFDLWREGSELSAEKVAKLSGWEQDDIKAVTSLLPAPASFLEPRTWSVLQSALRLGAKIDIRIRQVLALILAEPSAANASALRSALRSKYTAEGWRSSFKALRDQLRRRERDALVGYLTSRKVRVGLTERFFIDSNDLLPFFLVDVEMEPDTQISRIRLALNSVQLFVQRIFMGLESQSALLQLDRLKEQWTWMQNYRVWEANRKVFLFPENWIEPGLRDDKTELFRELEEELVQDDLTNERAEHILHGYVEGMSELSDLLVVGMCSEGRFYGGNTSVYHLVARTRSKPFTYYHRSFQGRQFTDGVFTPWRKIPVEIDADAVTPAIAEGSLRILWPMVTLKEKVVTGTDTSVLGSTAELRLMWSTLESKTGRWSKPRLGRGKVFDPRPVTVFDRDKRDDGPDTSYYHFQTASAADGGVMAAVYKTQYPGGYGGNLYPTRIGTFVISASGDDYGYDSDTLFSIGNNWPVGSVLLRNAAHGTNLRIEGLRAWDTFGLRLSEPFFSRVPDGFRAIATNFGYLTPAEHDPFLFEASSKKLFALNRGPKRVGGFSSALTQVALFTTFDHPVLSEIKGRLRASGPAGIMQRLVQALPASTVRYYYNYSTDYLSSNTGSYASGYPNRYSYYSTLYLGYHIAGDREAWGVAQRDFETQLAPSAAVERPFPLATVEFGYGTPAGVYNWELFFHAPMLIAERLSQDMRFEDAMKWYHYVFDPRQDLNQYEKTKRWAATLPAGARYWNFLPFFANRDATDTLLDVFGVKQALSSYERQNLARLIDEWRSHPFSPHLIARQRISAYQKFVVMKYLDNLVAWADQLFRQDSFESINQATQLYVLAADILGKRPEVIEPLTSEPRYTYRELEARGITDFANALVEVENLMVATSEHVEGKDVDAPSPQSQGVQSTALLSLYFSIPRNDRLDRYWDTVQDRLFKIRNSMSIDGVKRTLALFEPPIDPALLVRAAAAGLDLGAVLSQLGRPLPCYRFNVWMQKSTELAGELKSFGGALLAALEKADAEELSQLRQGHEIRMLKLMRDVRKEQLREAEQNVEVIRARRKLAEDRFADYSSREFISQNEAASLQLTSRASGLETAAGVFNTIGGALGAIPQIQAGFISATAEFGGLHLASIFSALASGMNVGAGVMRAAAGQASTIGGYERRKEDWDLQARQAKLEMDNIDKELVAAEIRAYVAQKELENQEVQLEQSEEVSAFLKEKFTSRELYQWMISQLSRTYQQIYKLTYDVAKTAERAFQFELGEKETSFVQFAYMDSLRQGLLAGEKLTYDLKRMDIAYLERNKRELEITKPISLAALNPLALQDLREHGACEFSLPEVLFDLDFPGHYFRRMRAVRVTIPCVTGPYTSVSAKLSLLGSAIRVESTANPAATEYPYKGYEDSRFVHDVGGIQSIATSTAQDDAGLFELNFRDERYLPFEGAGAISRFRLELPEKTRQFDYHTISDIVVSVSYTAREAGGSLKLGAQNSVQEQLNRALQLVSESPTGLVRVLSMKREFPQALHQLLASKSATLSLQPEHFPFLLRQQGFTLSLLDPNGNIGLHAVTRAPLPTGAFLRLGLNGGAPGGQAALTGTPQNGVVATSIERGTSALLTGGAPESWVLTQDQLSPENVDDLLFVVKYTLST